MVNKIKYGWRKQHILFPWNMAFNVLAIVKACYWVSFRRFSTSTSSSYSKNKMCLALFFLHIFSFLILICYNSQDVLCGFFSVFWHIRIILSLFLAFNFVWKSVCIIHDLSCQSTFQTIKNFKLRRKEFIVQLRSKWGEQRMRSKMEN